VAARNPDAHVDSWYAQSADPAPAHPSLQGRETADVVILGAGLTGLSAALELAEAGLSVIVVEARRVGWGASGRNGGQVIVGFGCDQSKLAAMVGMETSRRFFDWSLEGVDMVRERIVRHGIQADWRDGHAHVAIKPRHLDELKGWQDDLGNNYGYPLQWWGRERLQAQLPSPRYIGALFDPRSGHLHPLNFTLGLARAAVAAGVRIFEHSPVLSLQRGGKPTLRTADGEASGNFCVLAGNALVHGIAPELDDKIMPVGTYVGATEPRPDPQRHGGGRHQLGAGLFPAQPRPPAAVRRPRQLLHPAPAQPRRHHDGAHDAGLPTAQGREIRLGLGRPDRHQP
jgi:gamma-glutamylputrescine oxidase